MYIICFYWNGDRWNNPDLELASKYVNNLYYGVKKFVDIDFQFICFTNENLTLNENIEIRKFPIIGKGVLPRMFMFSKDAGLFGNQVLCLDLDLIIVNSLNDFVNYKGDFCVRKRFKENKLDGDIISFYANKDNELLFYQPFVNNVKSITNLTGGYERIWIDKIKNNIADTWDEIAPNQILSYKNHIRNNNFNLNNSDVRIISFHGKPRPHEIKENWIKKYWI